MCSNICFPFLFKCISTLIPSFPLLIPFHTSTTPMSVNQSKLSHLKSIMCLFLLKGVILPFLIMQVAQKSQYYSPEAAFAYFCVTVRQGDAIMLDRQGVNIHTIPSTCDTLCFMLWFVNGCQKLIHADFGMWHLNAYDWLNQCQCVSQVSDQSYQRHCLCYLCKKKVCITFSIILSNNVPQNQTFKKV